MRRSPGGSFGEILRTKKAWDARSGKGDTFDIVAISGTSAGALCALATWYGLVPNTADRECGNGRHRTCPRDTRRAFD